MNWILLIAMLGQVPGGSPDGIFEGSAVSSTGVVSTDLDLGTHTLYWDGATILDGSTDRQLLVTGTAGTQGVIFDWTTDGKLALTDESGVSLAFYAHNYSGTSKGYGYGNDSGAYYFPQINGDVDGSVILLNSLSNWIVINEYGDRSFDFKHPTQTNPTMFIQSANQSLTEWIGISHDQTDGVIETGSGGLKYAQGVNGAYGLLKLESETLTFAAGGEASKTTSGLIPDGAYLKAVVTRVITAGTNCSGYSIGDGSDVDIFGADIAVADATTSSNADATANWSNPQLSAAEVTLTGTDGASAATDCVDLVVRVEAWYETFTASTSD